MKKSMSILLYTLAMSSIHFNYTANVGSWRPPGTELVKGHIITPATAILETAAGEGAKAIGKKGAETAASTVGINLRTWGELFKAGGAELIGRQDVQVGGAVSAAALALYLAKRYGYDNWQMYFYLGPLQNILSELAKYSNQLKMHNANKNNIQQNFNTTLDRLGKIEANNHYAQFFINNLKLLPIANINLNLIAIQDIINKYLPPLMRVTAHLKGIVETSRMDDLNQNDINSLIDAAITQANEIKKVYQYTPWAWYRRSQLEQKISTLRGAKNFNLNAATNTLQTTINDLLTWTL